MAWMFLEDAEMIAKNPPKYYSKLSMHLERYLGSAAIFLRTACEEYFGRGNLRDAPNQQAMWFISEARHIVAHASASRIQGNTKEIQMTWSNIENSGEIKLSVLMTLNLDNDTKSTAQEKDQAQRFMNKHGSDVFLALHSATELCAEWVGLPLDEDFHALRDDKIGHLHLRARITDPEKIKGFLSTQPAEGILRLGDEKSVEIIRAEENI